MSGVATISTAICTRDDIMLYLISMGLDPKMSFKIMEKVRKGKVKKGGFDEGMMCHGIELVKKKLQEIKEDEDSSAKDDDLFTTLEVCYEFYLRGFTFAPIDIYHSHATKFQIEAGQLRPPFVAVAGLGETAAWDLMNAREGREFLSVEEFADACPKVSKTLIDQLQSAGAFGDLPLTSQLTLF